MFPLLAPTGTGMVMLVLLHEEGDSVAGMPLNVTVLVPGVSPKPAPVSVTGVPITPVPGEYAVMIGITSIVFALLDAPFTVVTTTSMKPGTTPAGTGTTIFVSIQELGAAGTPPNVTEPGELPKLVPRMVTGWPNGLTKALDDMLVMVGDDCAWTEMEEPKTRQDKIN